MKLFISILILANVTLYADFFKSAEKAELKYQQERDHYCQTFTKKAIEYEKTMRNDELAHITLGSYKKRAKIFCSKEEAKKIEKIEKKLVKKPKYVKDISREDERLCKIFQAKLDLYQKTMREDELAYTTLESYKKRTQIFCSKETLARKEQGVLKEDEKLCKVFQQGPVLCKKFDKNFKLISQDELVKVTLSSFEKRAEVFCSAKPLNKKDLEVYQEHKRLCSIFNDKIIAYQKNMRNDALAYITLESYKKRAAYFCASKRPETKR